MFNATPLSLLHPLLPPKFPGSGASVNLDIAPICWPLLVPAVTSLAVINLQSRSLLSPGVPHCVPLNPVYLVCLPPLCCPRPAPSYMSAPRYFPLLKFTPSLYFPLSPSHPLPPLPASTGGPAPCRSIRVCVVFFAPLSHVHPPCSLLFRCLLVSSGYWFLFWV